MSTLSSFPSLSLYKGLPLFPHYDAEFSYIFNSDEFFYSLSLSSLLFSPDVVCLCVLLFPLLGLFDPSHLFWAWGCDVSSIAFNLIPSNTMEPPPLFSLKIKDIGLSLGLLLWLRKWLDAKAIFALMDLFQFQVQFC